MKKTLFELRRNGIAGVQKLEGFKDLKNDEDFDFETLKRRKSLFSNSVGTPVTCLSVFDSQRINLSMELSGITTLKSEMFVDEYLSKVDPTFTSFSFSESKFRNFAKTRSRDFIRWSQRKMVRIYPDPTRVDSSNFNPVPFWTLGCQCVALNYQTPGMPMHLNHGQFLINGSCGYVLKPDILLKKTLFDIASDPLSPDTVTTTIKFEIISGHLIPKPDNDEHGEIIDPYIKINVFGVPKDKSEYKTRCVDNNGLNPVWGETCIFRLRVPDVALFLFRVMDQDTFTADDFIGYYCLPFRSIQQGYRHIPMFNKRGVLLKHTLIFVKIKISEGDADIRQSK